MRSRLLVQILRYGGVGISLNAAGYGLYLGVTTLGLSPLLTITIFYPLGILAGYYAHGRYTFSSYREAADRYALHRYIAVYVAGFLVNAGMIWFLPKYLALPHQLIQLCAIFVCAAFLFAGMRLFVFERSR